MFDGDVTGFVASYNTNIIYSILEVLTYPPCPAPFPIHFRELFYSSSLQFFFCVVKWWRIDEGAAVEARRRVCGITYTPLLEEIACISFIELFVLGAMALSYWIGLIISVDWYETLLYRMFILPEVLRAYTIHTYVHVNSVHIHADVHKRNIAHCESWVKVRNNAAICDVRDTTYSRSSLNFHSSLLRIDWTGHTYFGFPVTL